MIGELPPGTELGAYRLLSVIGRGGMGVVYLAEDAALERRVALKVLAPQYTGDASFRTRFERESRLAAALDHPNVVPIYEAGESNGVLFIAMRYVAGPDLRTVLDREGPFGVTRTLGIAAQLASALDAAHASGLIHRDVKPGNVLLAAGYGADGSEHVYLTDFGLTKHSSSKSGLTQLGQLVGTIDYIAPEQISGGAIDGRADLYALGCVVFEMLAGRAPFVRDTDLATMAAHLHEPPPKLTDVRPDLPPSADEFVAKALAKKPEDRYASGTELVRAARTALLGATTQPTMPAVAAPTTISQPVSETGAATVLVSAAAAHPPTTIGGPSANAGPPASNAGPPASNAGPPASIGPRLQSGPPAPSRATGCRIRRPTARPGLWVRRPDATPVSAHRVDVRVRRTAQPPPADYWRGRDHRPAAHRRRGLRIHLQWPRHAHARCDARRRAALAKRPIAATTHCVGCTYGVGHTLRAGHAQSITGSPDSTTADRDSDPHSDPQADRPTHGVSGDVGPIGAVSCRYLHGRYFAQRGVESGTYCPGRMQRQRLVIY